MSAYISRFPIRANIRGDSLDTITPDRLSQIWDTLEDEERVPWLFYDGLTANKEDYIRFMCDPQVYAYAVYDHNGETPLATYFVNNFVGDAAMMHYCFFMAGQDRRYEIGIDTCNFLLRNSGISALIGLTPRPFRHAWRYALRCGFRVLGVIPRICKLEAVGGKPRLVDGVLTLCTPQTLLEP